MMDNEKQMYANSEHKRGQLLMDEQKFEKAIISFNKALSINPDSPDILSHRGVAFLHLNQKKKCFDDLELSLNLDKNYAYRYACLAYAKAYFGDLDGAIILYEKAVEIEPDDAIAHNNLGLLREKKGYIEKSKKDFERADELEQTKNKIFQTLSQIEIKEQQAALQIPKGELLQPKKLGAETKPSFIQISKDLVTKKNTFKEFIRFIKNGFKLTEK